MREIVNRLIEMMEERAIPMRAVLLRGKLRGPLSDGMPVMLRVVATGNADEEIRADDEVEPYIEGVIRESLEPVLQDATLRVIDSGLVRLLIMNGDVQAEFHVVAEVVK